MDKHICIIGVVVNERTENAAKVQDILTKCGSKVLHRSGIPNAKNNRGIINITMEATKEEVQGIVKELGGIAGVTVDAMVLTEA